MSNQSVEKLGATITRLTFGVVLLAHGLLKVLVFTVPGTVGFFGSLGLPPSIAYLTIFGEIVGGSAIILGLYTRIAAILSLPIMLGALWVHSGNGWLFSNEGGGWEFTLVLVALAVAVAFQGNGAFAIRKFPILDNFVPRPLRS